MSTLLIQEGSSLAHEFCPSFKLAMPTPTERVRQNVFVNRDLRVSFGVFSE